MKTTEKLALLREQMSKRNIDAYIVPTEDFHASEYVGDYFKCRAWLSGFTGSAGTLVVTKTSAHLWVDGRYFLQGAQQLEGSTIELMKTGEKGVPDLMDFLAQNTPENGKIGFDARVISCAFADLLAEKCAGKNIIFGADEDLTDIIWEGRPALSAEKVWELAPAISGEERSSKLNRIREKMAEEDMEMLLLCDLMEIAWALNLRGADVACTPVFLGYMLIAEDKAVLYANPEIFSEEIKERLAADKVEIKPYASVTEDVKKQTEGKRVWADKKQTNYALMCALSQAGGVLEKTSPVQLMKGMKNKAEIQGMIKAHIEDAAAVTHFMYWIKNAVKNEEVTELSATDKLHEFRKAQEDFLDESFDTIMGYAHHGAIVHYKATPESNIKVEAKGLLLIDSGGQYTCGTTDITRTFAMGEVTDEEKRGFTLVLKGHLNLANAHFKYGCGGEAIDYLAREALWEQGMDYNHGTGHGVGFILSVHEGPERIHYNAAKDGKVTLEDGMIFSNEPGLYIEGKFGVRHENLVLCEKETENEYGTFMHLRTLTMVPFDKDALDISLLTDKDKERLNAYHAMVWENINSSFEGEEREWLKKATAPVE